MFQQPKSDRRFHRVALSARVKVIDQHGTITLCECLDFSEDGIDLCLLDRSLSFSDVALSAGTVVDIEIDGPENAPRVKAAIIKASSTQLGLRFLNTPTP